MNVIINSGTILKTRRISQKSIQWGSTCAISTDGGTNMAELTVAFRSYFHKPSQKSASRSVKFEAKNVANICEEIELDSKQDFRFCN